MSAAVLPPTPTLPPNPAARDYIGADASQFAPGYAGTGNGHGVVHTSRPPTSYSEFEPKFPGAWNGSKPATPGPITEDMNQLMETMKTVNLSSYMPGTAANHTKSMVSPNAATETQPADQKPLTTTVMEKVTAVLPASLVGQADQAAGVPPEKPVEDAANKDLKTGETQVPVVMGSTISPDQDVQEAAEKAKNRDAYVVPIPQSSLSPITSPDSSVAPSQANLGTSAATEKTTEAVPAPVEKEEQEGLRQKMKNTVGFIHTPHRNKDHHEERHTEDEGRKNPKEGIVPVIPHPKGEDEHPVVTTSNTLPPPPVVNELNIDPASTPAALAQDPEIKDMIGIISLGPEETTAPPERKLSKRHHNKLEKPHKPQPAGPLTAERLEKHDQLIPPVSGIMSPGGQSNLDRISTVAVGGDTSVTSVDSDSNDTPLNAGHGYNNGSGSKFNEQAAGSPKSSRFASLRKLTKKNKGHSRSVSGASNNGALSDGEFGVTSPTSVGSSNGSKHASLKDRLKGEVKIMKGKMTHDEELIEEGNRIKGGLSHTSA